jgi:hypothetical protein
MPPETSEDYAQSYDDEVSERPISVDPADEAALLDNSDDEALMSDGPTFPSVMATGTDGSNTMNIGATFFTRNIPPHDPDPDADFAFSKAQHNRMDLAGNRKGPAAAQKPHNRPNPGQECENVEEDSSKIQHPSIQSHFFGRADYSRTRKCSCDCREPRSNPS